jgi:transcriptional regulator with XRE-family HTH domain
MGKALGLSDESWSRYERSLTMPNLFVVQKVASYFGVSLDDVTVMNVDASHVTVIRLKQAEKRLAPKNVRKLGLSGKVWELVSINDNEKPKESTQIIDAIANLLHDMRTNRHKKPADRVTYPLLQKRLAVP